jgi:hypothetical protein
MAPSSRAHRLLSIAAVSVAACGAVLLASSPAHAQRYYVYYGRPAPPPPPAYGPAPVYYGEPRQAFVIGADLEGALPLNMPTSSGSSVTGGGGFKIRVGEQFRFPGLRVTPELGYGFDHLFAQDQADPNEVYGQDLHRVFAGARLAFGRVLVPVIYAHGGFGWRGTDNPNDQGNDNGFMFDVGGAVDLRVIPHFGIGAHVEYDQIFTPLDQPKWLALGLHADIVF